MDLSQHFVRCFGCDSLVTFLRKKQFSFTTFLKISEVIISPKLVDFPLVISIAFFSKKSPVNRTQNNAEKIERGPFFSFLQEYLNSWVESFRKRVIIAAHSPWRVYKLSYTKKTNSTHSSPSYITSILSLFFSLLSLSLISFPFFLSFLPFLSSFFFLFL